MKKLFTSIFSLAVASLALPVFAQSITDEFSKNNREYYLFYLDEDVKTDFLDANAKNTVIEDLRVDDTKRFLYIWSDTYVDNGAVGSSYYGGFNGYLDLKVGSVGWSGAGFALNKDFNPDYYIDFAPIHKVKGVGYTLHIALKSTSKVSHLFSLWGGENLSGKVCIGSNAFVDNGVSYQPIADFAKDGKWHLVEIPVTEFWSTGFRCPEPFNNGNYFSFLSGGVAGTTISMDAIFIYKENDNTGIEGSAMNASNLKAIVTNSVVTFLGVENNQLVLIFDITGKLVKTLTEEPIMGVDELNSGVYVAKSGNSTAKFLIK